MVMLVVRRPGRGELGAGSRSSAEEPGHGVVGELRQATCDREQVGDQERPLVADGLGHPRDRLLEREMMERVRRDHDVEATGREREEISDVILDAERGRRAETRDVDHPRREIDRGDLGSSARRELSRQLTGAAADLEHAASQRNARYQPLDARLEAVDLPAGWLARTGGNPIEVGTNDVGGRHHLVGATHRFRTVFQTAAKNRTNAAATTQTSECTSLPRAIAPRRRRFACSSPAAAQRVTYSSSVSASPQ